MSYGFNSIKSNFNGKRKSALQCLMPLDSTDSSGKPKLTKGVGPVTFNRASKQLVLDHEGQLRPVYDGCAGIEGSRIVTNWCSSPDNLNGSGWSTAGTASKTATSFTLGAAGSKAVFDFNTANANIKSGASIRISGLMSVASGTAQICLTANDGTAWNTFSADKTVDVSTTPKRFSVMGVFTPSAISTILRVCFGNQDRTGNGSGSSAATVNLSSVVIENVTGQTNQNPGEVVGGLVTQCFAYANPFTVDGNGVVTDSGVRTLLPAIKSILLEPATTNKCTNNNVIPGDTLLGNLVTANLNTGSGISVTNNDATHVVSFSGSGLRYQSDTTAPLLTVTFTGLTVTAGKIYEITTTATGTGLKEGGLFNSYQIPSGTVTTRVLCIAGGTFQLYRTTTNVDVTLSSISIKEVQFAVGTKATALNPTAVPGLTLSGYTQTTGNLVVGAQYKINARTTLDFTTCGAANNTVGTTFTATGGTLGAGDSVDNLSVSLSIVDDTAAHQAAGIYAVTGGKAYKLDALLSGRNVFADINGTTTNTNVHSFQLMGAKIQGTLKFLINGGADDTLITGTSYAKYTRENITPSSSSQKIQILATSASAGSFILNVLEEQPFCTSPVIVQGAAATRAATVESLPSAGNIKGNDFTVYLESSFSAVPTGAAIMRLFSWYVDANNRGGIRVDGTTVFAYSIIGGVNQGATWATTLSPNTTYKVAVTFSATGIKLFVNGALRATYSGALATNVLAAASIRFGSQGDDTGFFKGNLKTSQILRKVFSDAKCISMTQ